MRLDINEVRREAERQLKKERFDEAVAREVVRLKTHKPWYRSLFPFVVTIRRIK